MKQNFNELFSKMKPEAQERVKARSSELLRAMALADLRRAQASTQQKLANTLGVNQAWISRVERQTDMYLSTLRAYIEALGGELDVSARFNNRFVRLNQLPAIEAQAAVEIAQTPSTDANATSSRSASSLLVLAQSLPNRALPDIMPLYGDGIYSGGVHAFGMRSSSALVPAQHHNVGQRTMKPRLTTIDARALVSMQDIDAWLSEEDDERVTTAA